MGEESPKPASTPTGAVFLSYASQDAEAAQRICAALQAAGIEVWFDQSELRGGDSSGRSACVSHGPSRCPGLSASAPSPSKYKTMRPTVHNAGNSQPPPLLVNSQPLAPCTRTIVPSTSIANGSATHET